LAPGKAKQLKFRIAEKAGFKGFNFKIRVKTPGKQALRTAKQKQKFSTVFLVFCLAITIP
jgi:hypothetical protein